MKLKLCILAMVTSYAGSVHAQLRPDEIKVADPFESYGESSKQATPLSVAKPVQTPETHLVLKGDTLWSVTGHYVGSSWEWPRIWSYNPEITNPHWIYPGSILKLRLGSEEQVATLLSGGKVKIKTSLHKSNAVFLRNEGFLERDALEAAGVITGANSEHMLLDVYDQIYVRFEDPKFAKAGQELAIFAEVPQDQRLDDEEGELIRVYGTVRIEDYDHDTQLSRGVIVESLDPVERGYKVAPMKRRFVEVEPRTNRKGIRAKVVASLRPQRLNGDSGVVFVNVGREQGVEVGNRFIVVSSGDPWQQSMDSHPRRLGSTVELPDQPNYPDEAIAELRVVDVRKHTAACMVTSSVREVLVQDRAEMPKGY